MRTPTTIQLAILALAILSALPLCPTIPAQEPAQEAPKLLPAFRQEGMRGIREILFAVRRPGSDPHWYANFGHYAGDEHDYPFTPHGGGSLRILDLDSGQARIIFEDKHGSVRDPILHSDGETILFSYLKEGTEHYNLYQIKTDGSGLRQITSGDYDDIEPCILPGGDILFCSTRCDRFVQCWVTQVATIHRCGPNGENIRPLSANVEQDNTPWLLADGRVIYTRWEYVDRDQVSYHHLWTMNPDGTRQMVLFGNQFPGMLFIGAKPVPNSPLIAATISPGHGEREHYGRIALINPQLGPDDFSAATYISKKNIHSDPWPFSEGEFMAAKYGALVLVSAEGKEEEIYRLPKSEKGYWINEPRPIIAQDPPPELVDLVPPEGDDTGVLILSDIYAGRQMAEVPRGTVKELLVLETLPEPIHYSGGMDQMSYIGTFTLERIWGTVPVSPEGAAAIRLPAGRSFLFIALDHQGRSVKRMHSFTSVMPGEVTSCIGCHERRTEAPGTSFHHNVFTAAAEPRWPEPLAGIPDVYDFPRDIQPLFDKYCVECHNADRSDGGVDLTGDWMPIYCRSYWEISRRSMLGDNRNRKMSDFPPYAIGSQASTLYQMLLDHHQGVEMTDEELRLVRFWLETGAPYAGTYAANGTGLIGWFYKNVNTHNDKDWPETAAMAEAITRRCDGCHVPDDVEKNLPHTLSEDREDVHQYQRYVKRHDYFNLSRPEKSKILRMPLAEEAGGFGRCVESREDGTKAPIFASSDDPDYQVILAGIQRGRDYILYESNRFTMRPFVPSPAYVREMKRYGVLPQDHDPKTSVDPYELDRKYWASRAGSTGVQPGAPAGTMP